MDVPNGTSLIADAESIAVTVDPSCNEVDTDFLRERFWIAVVFGITVSLVSIVENIFVFFVFVTSKQHRKSYNLYLLLLAFLDVFMGMSYIMLMSARVLVNYTQSYMLNTLWAHYMVPMLNISHIAMTTSSYLITFAAVERYAITVSHRSIAVLQANRRHLVITAFLIAFITKGTMFQEITVIRNEECIGGIKEWQAMPGQLAQHPQFNKIWRFYFRTISTIFAPFFILMYLNFRLVKRLMQNNNSRWSSKRNGGIVNTIDKQRKARMRAATRTLVILVCTYLMSNLLNVIVSIWEYVDVQSLFTEFITFYVISVDTVSLLTIVSCALRLPIYVTCQPMLRKEMLVCIVGWCKGGKWTNRRATLMENETNAQTVILIPSEAAQPV